MPSVSPRRARARITSPLPLRMFLRIRGRPSPAPPACRQAGSLRPVFRTRRVRLRPSRKTRRIQAWRRDGGDIRRSRSMDGKRRILRFDERLLRCFHHRCHPVRPTTRHSPVCAVIALLLAGCTWLGDARAAYDYRTRLPKVHPGRLLDEAGTLYPLQGELLMRSGKALFLRRGLPPPAVSAHPLVLV